MDSREPVALEKMIFRRTNAQLGRHLAVTPENSTMRHLSYGRIILNSSEPLVSFSNADREYMPARRCHGEGCGRLF